MIVPMKKVTIAGLLVEQKAVLSVLQDLGLVQITPIEQEAPPAARLNEKQERLLYIKELREKLRGYIEFLERYQVKNRNLLASLNIVQRDITKAEAEKLFSDETGLEKALSTVEEYKEKLSHISALQEINRQKIQLLSPWRELDIPLEEVADTRETQILAGCIQSEDENGFLNSLKNLDMASIPASAAGGMSYYILIAHRDAADELEKLIKQFNFMKSDLHDFVGTARDNLDRLEEEQKALENKKSEIIASIATSNLLEYMENMLDLYGMEEELLDAGNSSYDGDFCFVMGGWIPQSDCERMEKALKQVTDSLVIEYEDVAEDEEPPVLVRNNKIVSLFENITDAFSHPAYRDVDPNPLTAIFYSLFYGIMIGDVGYGIIITVACALILKFLHPKPATRKNIGVFCIGGIASIFFGIIFGGYFGVSWFEPLFAPLDKPLEMMVISVGIGVVHIFAGYCAMAWKNIKSGDIFAAIFDQGVWMLFITCLIMLAAPLAFPGEIGVLLGQIGKYGALITALALVATQGRSAKGIAGKLLGGLGSLYNITGVLGDVLSYTRLFALCLSSGTIAWVFDMMSKLLGEGLMALPFRIVVLLIGHSINLALSMLSAYVHTSRLHYVEFFGKFYEGNGEDFRPLSRNTEYIKIQ